MVYFIQDEETSLVKIGFSDCVAIRLAQLSGPEKRPLKVLGVLAGRRERERELHDRFSHLRETGEWFRADDDLAAYIELRTVAFDLETATKQLFAVKGDPAWLEWLKEYADFSGVSMMTLIDLSLKKSAKSDGFPKPMPKRTARNKE